MTHYYLLPRSFETTSSSHGHEEAVSISSGCSSKAVIQPDQCVNSYTDHQ